MKKPKAREGFVVNERTKVIHKLPTSERCNVDSIPEGRRSYRQSGTGGFRKCSYCFGKKSAGR